MEKITPTVTRKMPSTEDFDMQFKPKGAIAFFIVLIILGLIIWYGIYFLMLARV